MLTCPIPPDQASYAWAASDDFVETLLDGGSARRRADVDGATRAVTMQWTVSGTGYNAITAFYRQTGKKGLPFLISLVDDDTGMDLYTAYFTAGTFVLTSLQGDTYVLTATLEVLPQPGNDIYDNSILTVYGLYGDNSSGMLNDLATLVNINLSY